MDFFRHKLHNVNTQIMRVCVCGVILNSNIYIYIHDEEKKYVCLYKK